MNNPLTAYYKVAKLYTKLPSQGQFYSPGTVEFTPNGEVAVYAMTALDQINIKTPDALLNGDALFKVVQSCVPAVTTVKDLVEPDINTLLLAIRIASQGRMLELPCECPSCKAENNYQVDLSTILETQQLMDEVEPLNFNDELLIYLRPFNFEQRNLTLLNEIQESQAVQLLNQNESMDQTLKLKELGKHVSSMADRTFEIVAKSITHIKILKTNQIVDDPTHILEFIKGVSSDQANTILTAIKDLNKQGIDTSCKFVCQACSHTWDQNIDFDPASFFG